MTLLKRVMAKIVVIFPLVLMLSGCHILDQMDLRDETILPPAFPADEPPPPKSNGTIYQAGYEISLYEDHIARRVGDILTVRLEESTNGQKQATTKANKTNINNTNLGTQKTASGNLKPYLLGGAVTDLIFNNGTDLQFNGKGSMNESNALQGKISVTVIRVLSNNNLVIQGETWVTINQGREFIRLSGIVRSEDIDATNTISSQRIADARISYSGSGLVGNASKPGILTQILFKFFPY
jgi:flagellar L-ring protein FlgH